MSGEIVVRPITASRFKDVEALFMTDSIMRSCWDIWPRYAGNTERAAIEGYPRAPGARVADAAAFFGSAAQFRRAGFRKIAGPRPDLPTGWVPRYTMRAECS